MINIGDIRESRLRRKVGVSHTIWNEKRRSILRYFVTRILALALVQRNNMISAVNAVALKIYGANYVQQFYGPSSNVERPKLSRS